MNSQERSVYEDKATKDNERYQQQMRDYTAAAVSIGFGHHSSSDLLRCVS